MDTANQRYETEVTGWQRGLYEDVKATFRAPVVNWIFRTLLANEPAFTRYLWGQVKPVFETRAFGRLTVEYRDTVLSVLATEGDLPRYRRAEVDLDPAEFAELRGQLATFDVVAPRLAVLFETVDRAVHDERVGQDPRTDAAATAPLPAWLDRDRGAPPSMTAAEDAPSSVADVVDDVQRFHGFDDGLPSIYRCLLQWPSAFGTLWEDTGPLLESEAFADAVEQTDDLVAEHVDGLAHRPRLSPDDLRETGMEESAVEGVQELFAEFNRGPVETVLPALPVFANAFDAGGPRDPLGGAGE